MTATAPTPTTEEPNTNTAAPSTTTSAPTPATITAATPTPTAEQTNPPTEASTVQATTEAPGPVYAVQTTIIHEFVEQLRDRNSKEFKDLEIRVTETYDIIYRKRFGLLFIRSYVIEFRAPLTRAQNNNTIAEVGLLFNRTTPVEELPENKVVQETLIQAINSTTFNVSFVPGSVEIIRTPLTTAAPITNSTVANITAAITNSSTTTTANPPTTNPTSNSTVTAITAATNATTNSSTTTTANPPTTNPTSNSTVTAITAATNATTNSSTTTAATPTTTSTTITTTTTTTLTTTSTTTTPTTMESRVTRTLTFRSAGETFTIDLLNPSSAAFRNRASLLQSNLEPRYKQAFPTLRAFMVTSFSNGSIINNIILQFPSASAPNSTQIAEVLINAASSITAFNIDTGSVFVDGASMSSGVSHKISLITAFSMVLLSWLLSSQQ
ncbi:integumentary mucin C.1 [Fundulus heteroclitus]|uniref:integumentary mucin C.1 n=1 Tax=Fundulus heteroclitus TaxID=8078 RepID=UPI00165BDEC0|nr:integumentary mucin C.1 [Fundulus heteroclitus]